jgi:hypothetical protein
MSFIIEHRPDGLLQKTKEFRLGKSLLDTYIGRVTHPNHKMLLRFLDENIINIKFISEKELKNALEKWPDFAKKNGLELDDKWNEISIDLLGEYIYCGNSFTGDFVIGIINMLAN